MESHCPSRGIAASADAIHHNFFRWILAGKIAIFLLMVVTIIVGTLPAKAQGLDIIIQKPQQQIEPAQDLQVVPNVVCFPPFIKKNNKCVCPLGQQKVGNTCKPFQIQILCQAPFVPNNAGTKCVCPLGQKKVGNTCEPIVLQILCQAPFVPNNAGTKCVCPLGQKKVGNTCEPIVLQILCQAPFVPNNAGTKCVCPFGTKKVGNTCEQIQIQILCQAPFVPNNKGTKCVCPFGTVKAGNNCISIGDVIPCPSPFIKQNGQCVCPQGLEKVGNKCLPPLDEGAECEWPFVYRASTDSCVCARGYRLSNSGNQCIKIPPQPTVTKDTVREIQHCLNRLGYDAGPVDGAPGGRTLEAWRQFRRDEGLQARPQTLADDVTQDRLFQSCARLDQTPEPEPEEDASADPQGDGSITNFDPETGYPPMQCASEAVAILLQGLMGEENEIGICGEVCVPIPDGMTPAQVEGTSASVNWCRHCTTIGENGLLCSGEPADNAN